MCTLNAPNSLEELLIVRNGLHELPDTLGRLNQLRTLNVSYNHIKQLPDFLLLRTAKMRKPVNMQMVCTFRLFGVLVARGGYSRYLTFALRCPRITSTKIHR